ncbi:poly-gamma-glutamate biosynthesis protein PgsC/CapC [Alkalimarinus sediminis]|uniref:Poly-gamma-glutamate biosynthesis protein PgsC/CapC n=1 Tax=Alkalimarinus sediminis TaxID=1632866 RepID=A0A9E8KR60_9ALTE|nr:poly-gamma-glutamate biosynthesis protein PgsC/CapC [Alkalimarinus sediminis]UZW76639.1 poly-gamma-glutamate biosynthesis protein PgsC/CapC [Alkalimarinus sediminis]
MTIFPLPLFPDGGLASSVVVTVWVGIWVVAFLNLRFGFALSGLVVPGYLVPLLIVKPLSAGVILIEGIVTYFITLLLANGSMQRLGASEMFGRDRFFALVLVSILVRVVFDSWLLPWLGQGLVNAGIDFDYRNNLQSFGLIIVSLIANQMWNGGVRRGCSSLFLYLFITYLIVNFLVIPYTNFSISNLSFIYEDIASSILATPKAYIILLTTAYIASKMNLRYGWEFNGILIPSLLALQWYEPSKLLVTFVEAFIILWLGRACLKLPLFTHFNMEGSRLLLFFFNLSFIYKYLLSLILVRWFPEVKVSDYFAFGYLLSTLLALKMFQKDIPTLVTRATLQTSAFALIFASIIGYALTLIDFSPKPSYDLNRSASVVKLSEQNQDQLVIEGYSNFYQSRTLQYSPPSLQDLATYERAFIAIRQALLSPVRPLSINHPKLTEAFSLLASIDIDIIHTAENTLILKDSRPERAGGLVVINLNESTGLTLEVPAPLNENGIADLGLRMYDSLNAKALIYAGSHRFQDPLRQSDMLNVPRSFFQIAHERLSERNVLQLRGYTRTAARELYGERFEDELITSQAIPNRLWIKASLPEGLNVTQLNASLGDFTVSWSPPVFSNRQREYSREGFAELMLTSAGIRQLIASFEPVKPPDNNLDIDTQKTTLKEWLATHKMTWAGKNSESYKPAKLNELIFFDEQVLTPLFQFIDSDPLSKSTDELRQALEAINRMAQVMGYKIISLQQPDSLERFLVLTELTQAEQRYWGTYIFRLSSAAPYFIKAPRPLIESNSFNYAVSLFTDLNAKALLVPSSHALANADGTANVLGKDNSVTLFNRVHQSLLRHYQSENSLVIQTRGVSANQWDERNAVDIRLALWQNSNTQFTTPLMDTLTQKITDSGLSYDFVDGEKTEIGYEDHYSLLSQYMAVARQSEMVTLWLSEQLRRKINQGSKTATYRKQFLAMQIELQERDIAQWIDTTKPSRQALPEDVYKPLNKFVNSGDIIMLANGVSALGTLQLEYLRDVTSQQYFIAVSDVQKQPVALASIDPLIPEEHILLSEQSSVTRFIKRQSGWLLAGER